jgi:hypothetical protein
MSPRYSRNGCRKRFFLPVKVLRKRFRRRFPAFLAAAFRKREIRFSGTLAHLANPTAFNRLLRQLKSKNCFVFATRPFGGPEHVIKYLARYTHRVAISNGRLMEMRDGQVLFRWRDSADGNQQKLMTLDAVEFMRRFLLHVLPSEFVKIRHFGFLANCNRREALPRCRSLLPALPDQVSTFLTETQQRALERKCPFCRTGTLHIIERISARALIELSTVAGANTS